MGLLFVKGEESCGLWGLLSCLRERERERIWSKFSEEMVRWWVMCWTELTVAAGSTAFHVSHSIDELGAWHRVTWVPLWYYIWPFEFNIDFIRDASSQYFYNIFTINHKWFVVISSNLNLILRLLFCPNNNNHLKFVVKILWIYHFSTF